MVFGAAERVWTRASVLSLATIILLSGCGNGSSSSEVRANGDGEPSAPEPELARTAPALAWTGDALFVYGGSSPTRDVADGYLVDESGEWLARVPPIEGVDLAEPTAAHVDRRVVVLGLDCSEIVDEECQPGTVGGGVFDLDQGEWKAWELPPTLEKISGDVPAVLGVANGMVIVRAGLGSSDFWQIDPTDGSWHDLPDPAGPFDGACVAGDRLVVVSTIDPTPEEADGGFVPAEGEVVEAAPARVSPRVAALELGDPRDAIDGWAEGPSFDGASFTGGTPDVLCTDDAVVVTEPLSADGVVVYDLSAGVWRSATPAPENAGYFVVRVSTGSELLFVPASAGDFGLAYHPGKDTWRQTAQGTVWATHVGVWTGRAVVGVAAAEAGQGGPYLYQP